MELVIAANAEGIKAAIQLQIQQGRLKRLRRPPRPRMSLAPERRMRALLMTAYRRLADLVAKTVIPRLPEIVAAAPAGLTGRQDSARVERQDQFRERLIGVMRGVTIASGTILDIRRELEAVGSDVSNREKQTEEDTFKAVLGVRPLVSEPWLEDLMSDFAFRNQAFAEKHAAEFISALEETIATAVRSGQRAEQIEATIRKQYVNLDSPPEGSDARKLRNKARLLARDQTATLNADLTRARQTNLGVTRFRWRTAKDDRVRGRPVTRDGKAIGGKYPDAEPAHTVLEGKIFDWSSGADGLFPGQPINCRCVAEPVLSDLDPGLPSI